MSDIQLAIDAVEPYKRLLSRGRISGDDSALQAFGKEWHPEKVVELYEELALTKQKLFEAEKLARDASFDLLSVKKDLFQAEQAIRESHEQEPYGWFDVECNQMFFARHERKPETEIALYTKPVIIPESAAQLHIKELWDALHKLSKIVVTQVGADYNDVIHAAYIEARDVLAKQPDTRALDKTLLEARIDQMENVLAWHPLEGSHEEYNASLMRELRNQESELNKE